MISFFQIYTIGISLALKPMWRKNLRKGVSHQAKLNVQSIRKLLQDIQHILLILYCVSNMLLGDGEQTELTSLKPNRDVVNINVRKKSYMLNSDNKY